jgi:ribosome-associated translation inhibitor RaiA
MRVQIRAVGVEANEELLEYAAKRVKFALGRLLEPTDLVRVYLTEQRSPRRGPESRCVIHVPAVAVVHAVAMTHYAAVDEAADKITHAFLRARGRHRERPRATLRTGTDG